jgi:hypothetical protein
MMFLMCRRLSVADYLEVLEQAAGAGRWKLYAVDDPSGCLQSALEENPWMRLYDADGVPLLAETAGHG